MNPLLREIGLAVLIVVLAVLVSRLSKFILEQVGRRLVDRTKTSLDDVFFHAARPPFQAIILIVGVEIALNQVSLIPAAWGEQLSKLFFALYALSVYVFLYRIVGGLITWYGRELVDKTETDIDDKFLGLFRRIALLTLSIVVMIIILGRYGIEVSALVTTLGIGSLAIALAAQETLGDMISGFNIMVDRPFKVGDRVEIQEIGTWGDVVEVGIRSTRILTRDNRMVAVPNSVIGKGLIVNYSVPDTVYRVQTHVGVAYGSDLEHARRTMIDAIYNEEWVMKDKPIEALMLEFGDSALIFRVRCWIEHYVETRRIIDKMNSALYEALRSEGIDIPFPQRDLHLVSSVLPEHQGNGHSSKTAST